MRVSTKAIGCVMLLVVAACGGPEQPITQPELMPDPSPFVYPTKLWDQRVRGETLLLLHVTTAGEVDSVTISNSSGRVEFDSAAVSGARKLRFVPGRRGGLPIDMWTKLPVRFEVDSVKAGG